jgi:hypothetical protein
MCHTAVNTLLHLLGYCNRSSFHQCSTQCLFSLENTPNIEPVCNAFKFLGDTLTVPWYVVSVEWRLLLDGYIMEVMNCCGYSLSIRSYLMFLISLSKSLWPWHMTLVQLIKLWTDDLFMLCSLHTYAISSSAWEGTAPPQCSVSFWCGICPGVLLVVLSFPRYSWIFCAWVFYAIAAFMSPLSSVLKCWSFRGSLWDVSCPDMLLAARCMDLCIVPSYNALPQPQSILDWPPFEPLNFSWLAYSVFRQASISIMTLISSWLSFIRDRLWLT